MMIYREKYLSEIRGFYHSDLIKIITGVRRCGKSFVLEQIMTELSKETDNFVYLDFDDRIATADIETWQDIVHYIQSNRKEGLCYVFLDEVRPFIFLELQEYARQLGRECSVSDYLIWGGFPKRLEFSTLSEQKRYLSDLNETIVANDLINRYKIRKQSEFRKVINFILISNSRIYSAKSISDHMTGNGINVTPNTVQK